MTRGAVYKSRLSKLVIEKNVERLSTKLWWKKDDQVQCSEYTLVFVYSSAAILVPLSWASSSSIF